MRIFVDLDGVLADFHHSFQELFGVASFDEAEKSHTAAEIWDKIKSTPDFFYNLPLMPDAHELWEGVVSLCTQYQLHPPVVLTGVPRGRWAEPQKRAHVRKHFGHARVITCPSIEKSNFCEGRSVLIDDWTKYQHLWEAKGGVFILHRSATESLARFRQVLAEAHGE